MLDTNRCLHVDTYLVAQPIGKDSSKPGKTMDYERHAYSLKEGGHRVTHRSSVINAEVSHFNLCAFGCFAMFVLVTGSDFTFLCVC